MDTQKELPYSEEVIQTVFGEVEAGSEFEQLAEFVRQHPVIKRSALRNSENLNIVITALDFNDAIVFGHKLSWLKEYVRDLSAISSAVFRDYFYASDNMIPKDQFELADSGKLTKQEIAVITIGEPFNYMLKNASDAYKPAIIFNLPNRMFLDGLNTKITYYELVYLMSLVNIIGELPFPIIFLFDDETTLRMTPEEIQAADEERRLREEERKAYDLEEFRKITESRKKQAERKREFMEMIEEGKLNNNDN